MTEYGRMVSVLQWAGLAGLADDDSSLAAARKLIAKGEGPKVVRDGRRDGIRLSDHAKWARSKPWAKYLATSATAEREKRRKSNRRRTR
jgi:hypothetical protein